MHLYGIGLCSWGNLRVRWTWETWSECLAHVRSLLATNLIFFSSESHYWCHPKSLELILTKNLAAHWVNDKPMDFLVTVVAGTKIKNCPVVFLIKPTHLFIAKKVAKIRPIGWVKSLKSQLKLFWNEAKENKRTNYICFWQNNEIKINSTKPKTLPQQAPPIQKAFSGWHLQQMVVSSNNWISINHHETFLRRAR